MYFCIHYMDKVEAPIAGVAGYRPKEHFSSGPLSIISSNPSRPNYFILSTFYALPTLPSYQKTADFAMAKHRFPGHIDDMNPTIHPPYDFENQN